MSTVPTLPGITSQRVPTSRLTVHVLTSGPADGAPVVFVHGNVSSATFWEETMLRLPEGFRGIAPDLRGYGDTDPEPIDATRGLSDHADDVWAAIQALELGADGSTGAGESAVAQTIGLGLNSTLGSAGYALSLAGGADTGAGEEKRD